MLKSLKQIVLFAVAFVAVSVSAQSVPSAPMGVTGVAGNGQVKVTWTAVSDSGSVVTGYVVSAVQDSIRQCAATTSLTCTVTGLTNGAAYSFTVRAKNSTGTGPASVASSPVTPASVPGAPGAPTGVTATAGTLKATVSWSATSDTVTTYTVTSNPDGKTCTTSGFNLNCMVTDLTAAVSYTFTVTAGNSSGTGLASSPTNAVTVMGVPGAPTNLAGTAGNAQVVLTWSAPVSNGGSAIIAYTVTAAPGGTTCSNIVATCTVTGLTNGTPYTFTITASNSVGTGPASPATPALTPMTLPGAPTGVTGTALSAIGGSEDARIMVSWTAPASTGGSAITSYTATAVQDTSKHCTVAAPNTSCTISGFPYRTSYSFTATASNSVGRSANSAPSALATTVPTALFTFSKSGFKIRQTGSSVSFHLPEFSGSARISVVDLRGREVWSRNMVAGMRDVSWNRTSGRFVTSGVYVLRFIVSDESGTPVVAMQSKILLRP